MSSAQPPPLALPTDEDRARQNGLLVASVVLTVIASIFVLLRCISRFILIRTPGLDDGFIVGAWLLTVGYLVDIFVARDHGLGLPANTLTLDNMVSFLQVTLAIQVMYYTNVFCIKTSIVLTYLRFAVSKTFRQLCYATLTIHAVFFAICIIVTLAQCSPLRKMWDLTKTVEGSCINSTAFFYTTSSFNILTDFWIIFLPLKTLKGIQRPKKEKIALFAIFGVGAFAAVASIIRLHTIYIYTLAVDPFRDGIPVNLWSMIEVTVAISCASVSALKPIFSRKQRNASRSAKTSGPNASSSGPTGYIMQSQNANGPRRHVRLTSLDNSIKNVLSSQSSHQDQRSSMDKGQDTDKSPGEWAVPANLLQPPPSRRNEKQTDYELGIVPPAKGGNEHV